MFPDRVKPGFINLKSALFYFVFFQCINLISQPTTSNFAISAIPDSLLINAKAVVRYDSTIVNLYGTGKLTIEVFKAITILNKNAYDLSVIICPYNKNSSISNIKAQIYDVNGNEVNYREHLKEFDIAALSQSTIFSDLRLKVINHKYQIYPFTIVYSYKETIDETINYPEWNPVAEFNVSVIKSVFIYKTYSNELFSNLRYFERNFKNYNSLIKCAQRNESYFWSLDQFKAVKSYEHSLLEEEILPSVILAPEKFVYEGYAGNFDSWKNFGNWIAKVNEGRIELNENSIKEVRSLTQKTENRIEKVKIVYEYMQNKTRYVSVQVGIGGFQPMLADEVDRNGYGDCKALVNYTKALLTAVGIDSYYTLVQAGSSNPELICAFPSNQFNHAILCVPINLDTIWLECTSQYIPFDYLGTFTSDRKVMIVNDSAGYLKSTPAFHKGKSISSRKAEVTIMPDGSCDAIIVSEYSGKFFDDYFQVLHSDKLDQKKLLLEQISFPNFNLLDFHTEEIKTNPPFARQYLNLNLPNYCNRSGNANLILKLNFLNSIRLESINVDDRVLDIEIKWPIIEYDTVTYALPADYIPDRFPSTLDLTSIYGSYSSSVTFSDNKLIYTRKLMVNKGRYDRTHFGDIENFITKVQKADNSKVIIRKKDM